MDLGLKDKHVFITGAASGIGKAVALDFAREGAIVAISTRSAEKAASFLDEIKQISDVSHAAFVSDICLEGEPHRLAKKINSEFGQIDILINNAGSAEGITDPYCPISDWRKLFRINFEVHVEFSNEFLPYMKKQDFGRIINIISLAGMENSGPVTYCSSKAALTAYSRSMGRVLATEVNNVVMMAFAPGVVVTEDGHWGAKYKEDSEHAKQYIKSRCPLGRFGKVEEVSHYIVYMASEKTTFCHGGIYSADGGQSRHFMFDSYLS